MIFDHHDPVTYLKEQLEQRSKANPSYSLRAFAQKIGLSPGGLSLILANKKRLSPDRAAEIARSLNLTQTEAQYFICLNQLNFAKSPNYRAQILEKIVELRNDVSPKKNWEKASLEVDHFKLISEWYGLPCFELITETAGPWSAKRVAGTLGISVAEASSIIDRLKRLKLIKEESPGVFSRIVDETVVESKIPNEALQSYYEGVHAKSLASVREQGPHEKSIGSQVFVADPDDLNAMKKLTDEYLDALNAISSKGRNRSVVYMAFTNIFRLTPPVLSKREKTKPKKTKKE